MNRLEQDYQNFYKEFHQAEKEFSILADIEEQIVEKMLSEGYAVEAIGDIITKHAFFLKNKHLSEVHKFLEQHVYNKQVHEKSNELKDNIVLFYKNAKEAYAGVFEDVFKKTDQKIGLNLLRVGHSLEEIQRVLLQKSPYAKNIQNQIFVQRYCDDILENLQYQKISKPGQDYELAKKLYIEKAEAIQKKYDGYKTYNEFQEGKVIVSMMMEDCIDTVTLKNVLLKCSKQEGITPESVTNIIGLCENVKNSYQEIQSVKSSVPKNVADLYRIFARKYMMDTNTKILSGKDDRTIIKNLLLHGLSPEDITKALTQASPVAIEPGRKKEIYVSAILAAALDEKQQKNVREKDYTVTAALYDEKMQMKQNILREKQYSYGIDHNRSYYDGIVVREMLEEKQSPTAIVKVVAEKSPQANKKSEQNPKKTPIGYARWLLYKADKVLKAESQIMAFASSKVFAVEEYRQLNEKGVSVLDLYRAAVKERIETYPSAALHLNENYIDKDACEKLLQRYPDIKKDELAAALKEGSPRAQMAGIPQDYPEKVLETVEERIRQINQRQRKTKAIQSEYLRQCGISGEGVEAEANMLTYHDGRAAVKMLMEGILSSDIFETITENAAAQGKDKPQEYAKEIVLQAEKVKERVDKIVEQEPVKEAKTATQEYQQIFLKHYKNKPNISTKIDIAAVTEMILSGIYSSLEIKQTIQENSPVAMEPGRNNKYSEYVEKWAKESIIHEKRKLQEYTPIPRIKPEDSAEKEYLHQIENLKKFIHLPINPSIDVMIAKTLLQEGFEQSAIAIALEGSVCSSKQKEYGKCIVAAAVKGLAEFKEKIQEQERGLSLKKDISKKKED